MKDIAELDKNFKVESNIQIEGLKYYSALDGNFTINGVSFEDGAFRRMPEAVAKTVSEGVWGLSTNTAGGRVRFVTDSKYIAIYTKMQNIGKMPHFALTGSAGFDLYQKNGDTQRYIGSFVPPFDIVDGYESIIYLTGDECEYIINFPLYSGVTELYIGLDENAVIRPATEYKYNKPVVFYGSSITQGGCASRPGNSYQAIISRLLDCDYVNLGFSGNARAEDTIAEYIAELKMSCFVYDYDHNAPSCDHLSATHERMFKIIREKNPDLPVIMMTRPKVHLTMEEDKRLAIVKETYQKAVNSGDKNVYFIAGPDLIGEDMIETATVDNCHPNDSGFLSMALAVKKILADVLN